MNQSITEAVIDNEENYLPLYETYIGLNTSVLIRDLLENGDISDNEIHKFL